MSSTVLVTAPYIIPVLDRFRAVLERLGIELVVAHVTERLEEQDLLKYAGKFDGALCGDDAYTARVLTACAPRLKVISKWGTGVDSIDAEACERLGIKLFRTPNAFTTPVADSVLAYMLAFARQQPWMDADMKAGEWRKPSAHALSEANLGIIGDVWLLEHPDEAHRMGALGRERIRPHYTSERMVQGIEAVYEQLLAKKGLR